MPPGVNLALARSAALAATLALSQAVLRILPAQVQDRQSQEAQRPGWNPRRVSFSGDITPAQKAAAVTNLDAIEQVVLRVPELAKPAGFVITPLFSGATRRLGPGDVPTPANVLEYRLHLDLCVPTMRDGGCGSMTFSVNFTDAPGDTPIHDAQGRAIYIEAARGESYRTLGGDLNHSRDTVPFATETYYRLSPTDRSWVTVLFTAGRELPWKSVTREEYYNAAIVDFEGKNGEKLTEYRKGLEKSPYQQWLDGAAQRKKEREEALAAIASVSPAAEVAKMRKELEATERETGAQLKAADSTDPGANKRALAASHEYQDKVRAELAAMSPVERRLPAIVDATSKTGPNATGFALVAKDSPAAQRVLTPNYDFWRARRSPVEMRGIALHISASAGSGPPPPAVHHALWQTFQKLDWGAIYQLLDRER